MSSAVTVYFNIILYIYLLVYIEIYQWFNTDLSKLAVDRVMAISQGDQVGH